MLGIEGLRALAASSVLVYHVWLYGSPNHRTVDLGHATRVFENLRTGVTLFFVLSGFLLFRPFVASALRGRKAPSLRNYLLNRALRILPAYWVILLSVAILFERDLWRAPFRLLANLFLSQDYVSGYIGSGIVPAWSLAIEVVFYLSVPLLGGGAILLARRSGAWPLLAAFAPVAVIIAIGITAKILLRTFALSAVWEASFLTRADWFAPGMAVAVLHVLWEDGRLRLPRWWRLSAFVAAATLGLLAVELYYNHILSFVEYQTPMAFACALLLALVVFADPASRLIRLLTWRPVVAVGLGSYSLFLWHDPMVRSFRDWGLTLSGRSGFVVNIALVASVAGIASVCTYLFVERPALAKKRAWQRVEAPAASRERAGTSEPIAAVREPAAGPSSERPDQSLSPVPSTPAS